MLERISPRTPEPVTVTEDALGNSTKVPENGPLAELGVAPGAAASTQDPKPAAK